MALTRCPACGRDVSTQATSCPGCGQPQWKEKKTKWWLWIPMGLIAAFFTFAAISSNSPDAQEKTRQRAAIGMCWDEQGRKSNDTGTSQFIAGACERMEQKYRDRWGMNP